MFRNGFHTLWAAENIVRKKLLLSDDVQKPRKLNKNYEEKEKK